MGTDIHFFVERRESGQWLSCDKWSKNPYFTPGDDDGEPEVHLGYKDAFYHDRNYDLFAMLADVRNGSGFAGCDTGDGFVPIAEQRGVPDDASPEYRREVERGDGHSHSWVTLAELLAYDWTQTTTKRGVVSPAGWAQWRDTGKPRSWCGSIGGPGIRMVEPEVMEAAWQKLREERGWPKERNASAHLRGDRWGDVNDGDVDVARFNELAGGGRPYCTVSWQVAYFEQAKEFFGAVVPRLLRLGAPEDVRAVFFFDS